MKLVVKITIVFIAAMALVLVERAWERAKRDSETFVDDMRRDHRVTGRVLRVRLEELGSGPGLEAQRQHIVESANGTESSLRVEWWPSASGSPAVTPAQIAELEKGTEVQDLRDAELVSLFPARASGVTFGVLSVREPLLERDRFARGSIIGGLANVLVLTAAFALLAFATGRWLVGKPVQQLVEKARRVGTGDLSGPLVLSTRDELGQLASELNAMCDALAVARRELAEETRARLGTLEQLRHADRLATVGRLATGVAHELGTPLSVVRGYAQMIAEHEVSGDRTVECARSIERESDRMSGFIRQLLDFARRRRPEGTTSDAREVVQRSVTMLEPMMQKRRVHPVLACETPCDVKMDADALQQVVTNLVVNAIQAMPNGGAVRVAVHPAGTEARIDVRDEGTGIPEEALSQVFEPFFTTKSRGDGTGLGLSIVHGIVVEHGGRIDVETTPGSGTTFSVFLPIAAEVTK